MIILEYLALSPEPSSVVFELNNALLLRVELAAVVQPRLEAVLIGVCPRISLVNQHAYDQLQTLAIDGRPWILVSGILMPGRVSSIFGMIQLFFRPFGELNWLRRVRLVKRKAGQLTSMGDGYLIYDLAEGF